jgi:hypothetical protein
VWVYKIEKKKIGEQKRTCACPDAVEYRTSSPRLIAASLSLPLPRSFLVVGGAPATPIGSPMDGSEFARDRADDDGSCPSTSIGATGGSEGLSARGADDDEADDDARVTLDTNDTAAAAGLGCWGGMRRGGITETLVRSEVPPALVLVPTAGLLPETAVTVVRSDACCVRLADFKCETSANMKTRQKTI